MSIKSRIVGGSSSSKITPPNDILALYIVIYCTALSVNAENNKERIKGTTLFNNYSSSSVLYYVSLYPLLPHNQVVGNYRIYFKI